MPDADDRTYDLVLAGGRVIDPESGLDAIRNVGINGRVIGAVSDTGLVGRLVVDAAGQVVCPGFVDLHSHGQRIAEQRLQALDGVTTALELEAGVHPVAAAYARAAAEGRPIHYGYSASWALSRMEALEGSRFAGEIDAFLAHIADPGWQRLASSREVDQIVDILGDDLASGGLGIGVLVGYAPDSDPSEYLAVAALAARRGVPTYTHARDLVEDKPTTVIDGATEVVKAAAATGAHMHYCHLNSTSARHVDRVLALVEQVKEEGAAVTTEAYPYGTGMTGIGASFLAPERLKDRGLTVASIRYAPTGERMVDAAQLDEIRRRDPGGLAFVESLSEDDPDQFGLVERALAFPGTAIASDAMPLHWPGGRPSPLTWPIPMGVVTHPRSAGNFARLFRFVRERRLFSLPEAVARCTIVPARVVEAAAPAMGRKARIQPGFDADIVVFDPERISDQATYTDTIRPSTGIAHVIVDGTFVVSDGTLVLDALPGRPVRGVGA